MYAALRPPSHRRRLLGAAATLIVIALLAFVLSRPVDLSLVEPRTPDIIPVMDLAPEIAPDIRPDIPLQTIDLPVPLITVNLPDFERPPAPPALTSPAPATSPEAAPAPSGSDTVVGLPDGTGRLNGSAPRTGARLIPPVRTGGADAPFDLKSASRAGRVTSLNFCVTEAGRVSDVQLAASSGFSDMDTIAIDWLAQQAFTPGTLDGVRARMCATYDIRWSFSQATFLEAKDAARAHATTIARRSRYPRQFVYWPEDRPFPGCDAVTICKLQVP